jgi:5-methylcytosine-specific restriction enzyme B
MSINALVRIVHGADLKTWTEQNRLAFRGLFDGPERRYPKAAEEALAVRAPAMSDDTGVPYVAYIDPANPTSGPYGGTSFVMFPSSDGPCLVGLVVGTQGLAPDAAILGRPGHSRKAQAICDWLNKAYGNGEQIAWAKHDPTRTDIAFPESLAKQWSTYKNVFGKYGGVLYAAFRPAADEVLTAKALKAFLDLLLEERGHLPLADSKSDSTAIKNEWFEYLMRSSDRDTVAQLLSDRHFVIVQGPPGTGKTRMALELLQTQYGGNGRSVQFHPNTTYETFVGGLGPAQTTTEFGLSFQPVRGFLMEAAIEAGKNPKPYLLHIDEINRADLSKVLGEAIFLFESRSDSNRKIGLQYDFGDRIGRTFSLPPNLHVFGTMNTADRSIAIVDVAVRRRFAFVSLWPQMSVVQANGCELMQRAFREILSIFVEHATDDAFNLVPGHSYFLEQDDAKARRSLQVNLAPLLEEYLSQGYVGGFAEPIRSYLQWLRSL